MEAHIEAHGCCFKAPVVRPELCIWRDGHGCEQVNVDVSKSSSHERASFDEGERFRMRGDDRTPEFLKSRDDFRSIRYCPAGNFADHERVRRNNALTQDENEVWIAHSEMVDPHGSIDEDHGSVERLRGIFSNWGSDPPSLASLRALSRSIRAMSPARSTAVRSVRPLIS